MPFILLMLWPLLEIWVFIDVATWIGLPYSLLLLLAASLAGIWILWRQGFGAIVSAHRLLTSGSGFEAQDVFDGLCAILAGLLLILPGFIGDGIALLLLLPSFRRHLRKSRGRRMPDIIEGEFERLDR